MLLEGGVDGHLNPIQRSWCSVCLPGPRGEHEIARGVLRFPKMTSVPMSEEKRKTEDITYLLVLEAKSIRYRCIRVAVIIIVIRQGASKT